MYVWKGKEYELFEDLFTDFCNQYDICFNGCPISELCHKFEVKDIEHNAEILALLQVQEVTEQGSKLGRYLGIPVGRKFTIQGYSDTVKFCLLKDGGYETFPPNAHKSSKAIMQAIEDPSLVTPVKDYDFTKDERVFLRLLHQINPEIVLARKGNGQLYWDVPGQHMDLPQAHHILPYKLLPEILPGETVEVRYVV